MSDSRLVSFLINFVLQLKDISSLCMASRLGFAEIVKLLVDYGVQVNDFYEVNPWS